MSERLFSATSWGDLTPSDDDPISPFPVSIFVGGSGDIVAEGEDGGTATFAAVAGTTLPIQPRKVLATGTTATGLVALYN